MSLNSNQGRVRKFEVAGKELTLCQARIISLSIHGLQRKQLADLLGNSRHTIDTHLDRIYKLLELNDSRQVMLWALRNGFNTEGYLHNEYLFGQLNMLLPWHRIATPNMKNGVSAAVRM